MPQMPVSAAPVASNPCWGSLSCPSRVRSSAPGPAASAKTPMARIPVTLPCKAPVLRMFGGPAGSSAEFSPRARHPPPSPAPFPLRGRRYRQTPPQGSEGAGVGHLGMRMRRCPRKWKSSPIQTAMVLATARVVRSQWSGLPGERRLACLQPLTRRNQEQVR